MRCESVTVVALKRRSPRDFGRVQYRVLMLYGYSSAIVGLMGRDEIRIYCRAVAGPTP